MATINIDIWLSEEQIIEILKENYADDINFLTRIVDEATTYQHHPIEVAKKLILNNCSQFDFEDFTEFYNTEIKH